MDNFFDHVKRFYRVYGIKSTFQEAIQTIIGVKKAEIDTLYYLLNEYVDITKLPPTNNVALRNLQLCDLELLRIVDKLCTKYDLSYWLDGGTLLGAIRHKGFIPWDDDVDICMLRNDYDRFVNEFEPNFRKYNIKLIEHSVGEMLRVEYNNEETGIGMDIFPVDECVSNRDADEQYEEFSRKIRKVYDYYKKNRAKLTRESLASVKQRFIPNAQDGKFELLYHGPEFLRRKYLVSNRADYFPLKRVQFEQYEFNVPYNPSRFLSQYYGSHYLSFPRGGIKPHVHNGNEILNRAKNGNVDMSKILAYLKDVANRQLE